MPFDFTRDPRRMKAALAYAANDKSDPFALARIRAHMKNGLASFDREGRDCFYSADEYEETRTVIIDGKAVEYKVTAYKNLQRP